MSNRVHVSNAAALPYGLGLAGGFPRVALMLLLVLVWMIGWYWSTAEQIAGIWWRSETFAHGLVVLPISAWLIWSKRAHLGGLAPQPLPWMAIPVMGAGLGWLLGQMVNVNALSHAALVSMIVLAFAGALGWRLSRILAFPLLFLFFGVPIGEFMMPTLMDYTAEFTVFALRLSGVPVYQEGLFFIVPNGQWSVVEGCSGIRYLIASVMVGTLYAHLNYRSTTRRLLFVGVAIIVPIVANWLRAYFIVMLGYLSDNRVAAGVDHLIYGWMFFGIVILLMFWIGSFWREAENETAASATVLSATRTVSSGGAWLRLVPLAVVTAAFPLALAQIERPVEPFSVALQAPAAQAGWTRIDGTVRDFVPEFSGYRDELYQVYRRDDGALVGLYVAYYSQQRAGSELVAWGNRLFIPKQRWTLLTAGRDKLPVGEVRRTLLRDDSGQVGVWHWYWTNGRVVTRDVVAKLILALDHLTGQPDDAAFISVIVPIDETDQEALNRAIAFLDDHAQVIETALERAKGQE